MGMVIELNRDASNWSEVTNIVNYGNTFVSPDGKRFRLIRHKKAHYDENGNYKSGAQATVTIELDGKEQTFTTPKLKDLLHIQKEKKNKNSDGNASRHQPPIPKFKNQYPKRPIESSYEYLRFDEKVQHYFKHRNIIVAAKTKPFLLLAGISGTGKSRIVRELARACWDESTPEYEAQKPTNFEMIQVKPNWHDSTELMGYVSRVSGKPVYIIGDFLRFITKAWENLEVPHFLCLDEMNLATVEQYFAEFLSVIESRKSNGNGVVITDPILKKSTEDWYRVLTAELTGENETLRNQFMEEGITLPQNLIVVGTVNMDETTFSFSRKVLDRAMTIEMNEVDLYAGLQNKYERIGKLNGDILIGTAVEGVDVYAGNEEVCNKVLIYLQTVNDVFDRTPFKIAYRTRNEFLLYVVNNLPYTTDENGNEFSEDEIIAIALDEITSMKILSRIEGDDTKVKSSLLKGLIDTIEEQLLALTGEEKKIESVSIAKLKEMQERLSSGYTSFWS